MSLPLGQKQLPNRKKRVILSQLLEKALAFSEEAQSGFNKRNRTRRRWTLRDLVQGTGLYDCEDWQGQANICMASHQEGQEELPGTRSSSCPQREFVLGSLGSALRVFELIESGPPRLPRLLSLTYSQLIMDLNHISKLFYNTRISIWVSNWEL